MPQTSIHNPLLEVRDLSFRYGEDPVLNRLNFSIEEADFVALIGPNGAGKSSLMRLILGFLKPQQGQISIADYPPGTRELSKLIAYVPQQIPDLNLHFPASLEEIIEGNFYPQGRAWTRAERQRRRQAVEASLKRVGLAGRAKDHLDSLSGGEVQKVLLARALISEPKILFLDEPTAGVDQQSSEELYALLKQLNERDKLTILLITHELYRIKEICDRFLYLGHNTFFEVSKEEYGTEAFFRRLYSQEAPLGDL